MKTSTPRATSYVSVAIAALACSATLALAAPADIANSPLATSTSTVRSNLMLILDNSGSMQESHMPDSVDGRGRCYGYARSNTLFYDPAVTYTLPLQSTGLPFTAPSWPNAYVDGYAASPTTRNINSAVPNWGTNNGAFYYTKEDNAGTSTSNCPGVSGSVRLLSVATLPTAERSNYLIWYSYYRTRELAMRGAVGTVMASIDASRFRIGLSAISEPSTTDNNFFLNVRDFDVGTQKQDFFSRLYSISDSGRIVSGTPLRPALEKIGKYYANKSLSGSALASGQDPVQYSCQRNYTILTTDGYWNTGEESKYVNPSASGSARTPLQLDGSTAVGNPDAASGTPRPLLDDGRTQGSNWVTGGAGVGNTLADIAMYFYATDLRTSALSNCTGAVSGQDVCVNDVRPSGADTASHQHMTTYTMGLGVAGVLRYRPDYDTATSGDFYAIKQGTMAWPNPNPGSTSSTVTERIDDLWHTAVNGRGRYYSANNPADVVTGLTNALQTIQAVSGTGAAAATSTLQPVTGDNFVYLGTYTTVLWEGNIKALTIDTTTGAISTATSWEAKDRLALQTGATTDSRSIYFFNSSATNKLSDFTFANLNTAGKGAMFQNVCSMGAPLSQCPTITALGAAALANANNGTNLVNYLRGQTGFEDDVGNAVNSRLFRSRNTPLGDLINAAPVYVRKPPFRYTDAGYNTFATNNVSRTGVVYAAANDGMLHAFNASTGDEMWAFVPTAAMPNMYRLAGDNYSTAHRFFVDGTPVVGDVFDGTNWRTVLVGGMGAGGRSYYALDVTDPANPKALWEISSADDSDLGLTFGNPVIAKNKAGAWIVAFTSGYNNIGPGNGNGYLYVRNVFTGASIAKIATGAGNTTTPSNLGKISPWVNSETNNTAHRFYGGDMLGNVWRIDYDDNIAPSGNEAMLLARAETPAGVAQPITTRPQVTELTNNGNVKLVTIGTGRLLGATDVGDTTLQSLYVFKDTLASTGLGVLRSNGGMVAQTMSNTIVSGQNTRRIGTLNPVDWSTQTGWYVDFNLTPGERVNVDTIQVGNLLAFASNIPTSSICTPGGSSWLYFFDISNGNLSDAAYGDAMTAGLNVVKLGSGLKIIRWNIRGEPSVHSPGTGIGVPIGTLRRISWRELIY